jgi:hypothetical protein
MSYYQIQVKLNKIQIDKLITAIETQEPVVLELKPKQIDDENGEWLLITMRQLNAINKALVEGVPINIKISKAQIKAITSAMQSGDGILDSIGNFFKSASTGIKNTFNSVTRRVANKWNGTNSNDGGANDYKPVGYQPPKQSGFDKVANKVGNFDKFIDNIFSY